MPENPNDLAAEAEAVSARCEAFMEEAVAEGRAFGGMRAEVVGDRDAAQERADRAYGETKRAREFGSERREKEAIREHDAALREVSRIDRYLATGDLDPEYRRAVARQMAALARDDAQRELDAIAARGGDDPELRRTVAGYGDDAARAARYVANMFATVRELEPSEVRKARAEAREILDERAPG